MQEGRGEVTDISASPGRQAPANQLRPKEPPPMVIQGDFRKVLTSMTFLLSSNLSYLFSPGYPTFLAVKEIKILVPYNVP